MLQGYKTYIGILVAILPVVGKLLGFDIDTNGLEAQLTTLAGGLIALYGRFAAQPK